LQYLYFTETELGAKSGLMHGNIRMCFVSLSSYSLFNDKTSYSFGGIEVRSYLLSTGLAKYPGYYISYVVSNHNQPKEETFQNIRIFSHPAYPDEKRYSFIRKLVIKTKRAAFEHTKPSHKPGFPYYVLKNKELITVLMFVIWIISALLVKLGAAIEVAFSRQKFYVEDYPITGKKFQVYEHIGADIYCAFGVSVITAEVAAYCKHGGKKFIFFVADEHDIDSMYQPQSKIKNIYGHPAFLGNYIITQADIIIAQTQEQAQRLKALFNRDAVIITNPVDLENVLRDAPAYPQRQIALWIGRADRFKKMPLLLIQLAHACPDIQFEMIMNPEDPNVETEVYQSCPPNVIIHPHVPFKEVESFYSRAFVFINTSEFEGFPNTFLQAAKYGVPILSYKVDPDGFIEQYQTGIVAHGNFDKLVEGLYSIQADQKQDMLFSSNIVHYVKQHHNLEEKVLQLHTILQQMVN
jgi:hypothetical protein